MRLWRSALLMTVIPHCAPLHPYAAQLSPGRYEVHCRRALSECAPVAHQVCANGYNVEGTKTGSSGASVTISCIEAPPAPPTAPVAKREDADEDRVDPVPRCAYDYNCTGLGERCVHGKCTVVQLLEPAETDRCVIGASGSTDPVPMFPTERALAEFLSAPPDTKAEGFMLIARLNGGWIDAGVRCRTLGQFTRGRHIILVSGPAAGRAGWIAAEATPPIDAGAPDAANDPNAPGAGATR